MSDATFAAAREHFVAALEHLQAGRPAAAEQGFRASLALLPGRPSTLLNLAVALLKQGRAGEALPPLDQVLEQQPDDVDALGHRGVALLALHRPAEAQAVLERVCALAPARPEAWFQLAQTLQMQGRGEAALAAYDRCLSLQAGHVLAWTQRGLVLKDLGRSADAAASFEQALAHGGDPALVGWYLASVRGSGAAAVAPRAFVQGLFDDYAEGFERHLVDTLGYRAPEVLARLLVPHAPFGSALDLGCGTGLAAPLLRPMVQRLDGVDLSAGMLAVARARGLYDALAEAEIVEHLLQTAERHDLVLAADVFIYLGDLAPVFAGVRRVLRPDGWFGFSAEVAPAGVDWVLQPSLRYAHAEAYLRRLAGGQGFTVRRVERGVLRQHEGGDLPGLYLLLQARG